MSLPYSRSRLLGGILLIIGNCIGAGMLALPILTGVGGFVPGVVMFLVCWLFMTTTGLLLLEVNVSLGNDVSIISMADQTLGRIGKVVCWVLYLFLFYCLLIAYVAGSGALLGDVLNATFNVTSPIWVGGVLFVLIFGILVYLGTQAVDHFNRWLMLGLVVSYVLLIAIGSSKVDPKLLERHDWGQSLYMIPVLIISFGFHNVIPSLTSYLHGKASVLKKAVYIGSIAPLFIYLVWEWMVLGTVPLLGENGLCAALANEQSASDALKHTLGSSWVSTISQYFAFFALVTSFLAVSLSFADFLADGLKVKKHKRGRALLCALVLLPPLLISLSYPHIFLTAFNYAGGIGAVVLFGLIPALMVWVGRYRRGINKERFVPGGKIILVIVAVFAVGVLLLQISQEVGWIKPPRCEAIYE